eukprot:gene28652-37633_t
MMITGESVSENDRDLEKSISVADRIALFKRKTASHHVTKEVSPLPSPIPRQTSTTNTATTNINSKIYSIPSPLVLDGGVSVSQRISIYRKELETPVLSNPTVQSKAVVLESTSLSISERISKLREEQLSNSQISNPNRVVAVVDGSTVSDRVSMLMKQAEKSTLNTSVASQFFRNNTSRGLSITTGDSSPVVVVGAVATSPFLSKPELIIRMPASMERESKNKLELLLERLVAKDPTLTVLEFNNSTLLASEEDNFENLASLLKDNCVIVDIQLCNVLMKDRHCLLLVDALKTCPNLAILSIETNMLTGTGIAAVAAMAERHPTLRELRMDNQKMAVGIDAERAIANCLSQNTNIIRLSYTFREVFVSTYVNKYLQRNLDRVRQIRTGKISSSTTTSPVPSTTTTTTITTTTTTSTPTTTTPYPYPPISIESDAAFLSPEMRAKKEAEPASTSSSAMSVAERVSKFSQKSDRGPGSKPASNAPPPNPTPMSPANAVLDMNDGAHELTVI